MSLCGHALMPPLGLLLHASPSPCLAPPGKLTVPGSIQAVPLLCQFLRLPSPHEHRRLLPKQQTASSRALVTTQCSHLFTQPSFPHGRSRTVTARGGWGTRGWTHHREATPAAFSPRASRTCRTPALGNQHIFLTSLQEPQCQVPTLVPLAHSALSQ